MVKRLVVFFLATAACATVADLEANRVAVSVRNCAPV